MMGMQTAQKELFSYAVNLDSRVRAENPLRQIAELIDFTFVRAEVKEFYGYNGNESVDPAVIMKLMFLLFYDDVASERELLRIVSERLDYMWFLGYGLDDEIPNHSVLSKARGRWGVDVFEILFTRIVAQCKLAGLIEGKKIHMDGSLVDANASNNAVLKGCPELVMQLREQLRGEMTKLDEASDEKTEGSRYQRKNNAMINTTDPDAAMVRKGRNDRTHARYKVHRVVDDARGVITATETTSGAVQEDVKLMDLVEQHEHNVNQRVETVVADSQYGTAENFCLCQERGIRSHMADRATPQRKLEKKRGVFAVGEFLYDAQADAYTCPAGQTLRRSRRLWSQGTYGYSARREVCAACPLRSKCHHNTKHPCRVIHRLPKQALLDAARAQSHSREAKRDRVRRKWLMEGSFADSANNHGLKRSRWRRLWRQQIQDYMIAAVQNVRILIRHGVRKPTAVTQELQALRSASVSGLCQAFTAVHHTIQFLKRFVATSDLVMTRKEKYFSGLAQLYS